MKADEETPQPPRRHLVRYERTWIALAGLALALYALGLWKPIIVIRTDSGTMWERACIYNRLTGKTTRLDTRLKRLKVSGHHPGLQPAGPNQPGQSTGRLAGWLIANCSY